MKERECPEKESGQYPIIKVRPESSLPIIGRCPYFHPERKIKPHIDKRIPLSDAAAAHELIETGRVMGKLVLKP